jgi:hypothetical protein
VSAHRGLVGGGNYVPSPSARDVWLLRCRKAFLDVAARYAELECSLAWAQPSAMPGHPGVPDSRPPVSLDAVDALHDVEKFALEQTGLARGALRLGLIRGDVDSTTEERTTRRLRWMAEALDSWANDDPDGAWYATEQAWRLANLLGVLLGIRALSAFPAHGNCPACNESALWVDPVRWVVRCASCRAMEPIGGAVQRWVDGYGT